MPPTANFLYKVTVIRGTQVIWKRGSQLKYDSFHLNQIKTAAYRNIQKSGIFNAQDNEWHVVSPFIAFISFNLHGSMRAICLMSTSIHAVLLSSLLMDVNVSLNVKRFT